MEIAGRLVRDWLSALERQREFWAAGHEPGILNNGSLSMSLCYLVALSDMIRWKRSYRLGMHRKAREEAWETLAKTETFLRSLSAKIGSEAV